MLGDDLIRRLKGTVLLLADLPPLAGSSLPRPSSAKKKAKGGLASVAATSCEI